MSRSSLLRSTSFMAACLLTLSGCSVGLTGARGASSTPPDQTHDAAAQEAEEEPTGKLEDTSPMDPLEYGNCTSSDIQDYDDELTDNDAEDTRSQAEAQVTKVMPASDQVSVTANELSHRSGGQGLGGRTRRNNHRTKSRGHHRGGDRFTDRQRL